MRRFLSVSIMLLCVVMTARAQELSHLPEYQPERSINGTLRLWGHGSPDTDFMGRLVKSWEEGFRRFHPGVQFENRMYGTASAMGALYTGVGDLAIMGREIWPFETKTFEKVFHYPPTGVDITTGSLDIRNMDFALNVFVHKDNPLAHLTLTQVDAVFGSEHLRGPRNIRTWGDLGLTGEWADKPINVYGFPVHRGFAVFFQDTALGGSHKWNCDMREFADVKQPDGKLLDGGQRILDALAQDRYGIAYSNLRYMNAQVKPLALAASNGAPYYEATKENLIQRKYPLTRFITTFFNRAPGQPVDPKVREFLRYILSREGQQAIVRDGNYLPLSEDAIRAQLKKLE
ncbi:MAG: phosphate transport system substrate-binding protein [Acidobacteriota bacterium]|nr:phosphate transport system substrate-binding protein [Acidobacteriota bacterium]